jgi:cytochrome c-type biogenesis protein
VRAAAGARYVSYVAGHSLRSTAPRADVRTRLGTGLMSLFFVLGFSAVFIGLGASATALGHLLLRYRYEASLVGGAIVIAFGLFMLGLLRHVVWFHRDLRFPPHLADRHPAAAFLLGVAFGFGWTPCVGPVLGAILTTSAIQGSVSGGVGLLAAYAWAWVSLSCSRRCSSTSLSTGSRPCATRGARCRSSPASSW